MATERELKTRINSVKNISQVTSALAAVSTAKMQRAQKQVEATRDYAAKAFEILNNLAAGDSKHPLLTSREEIKHVAMIVITGDRGLAGAYNTSIVTLAEKFLAASTVPVDIVAVGRKGRDLMIRRGYNVVASFINLPDPPSTLDTSPIAQVVVDDYLAEKYDQVFVAYTNFINLATREPVIKQLLPLKPHDFEGMAVAEYVEEVDLSGVSERSFSYEPGPDALLDAIVPRFTDLQVFQSYLEALASEHSARMMAMQNATENADVLIEDLTLERNKVRQTAITSEILDIVGGAEALAG